MTMPRGPLREALCVSSVMCAEASYPVKVYWAISSPMGRMYHQPMWNPDRFTRPVNTNLGEAWCAPAFRPNVTAPTMISTPRDVPPDADVVQQRHQPDAELVHQAVHSSTAA